MIRFWSKVLKGKSCWNWTASLTQDGYGRFQTGSRTQERAHRFSWILEHGQIPSGMQVLHKCDNPKCVRPDHLFLGTPKDNMTDKAKKGRSRGYVRFGLVEVKKMVEMRGDGMSQQVIGDFFGCHQATVSAILRMRGPKLGKVA
jgi:hypothetical protein